MRVKKNDTVLIISGKYRGRKGKILKAFPKKDKVLIEGVNLRKKHQKPKKTGDKGQVIEVPAPIDISNVKIICTKCKKATRIGYRVEGGEKYRICKKCDKTI